MKIDLVQAGDNAVMTLAGELTIYSVAATKAELLRRTHNLQTLDIDLSGVYDIDLAGLQWMLIAKRLPATGVRFVNHSAPVLRLLKLTNLGPVLGDPLPATGATATGVWS